MEGGDFFFCVGNVFGWFPCCRFGCAFIAFPLYEVLKLAVSEARVKDSGDYKFGFAFDFFGRWRFLYPVRNCVGLVR